MIFFNSSLFKKNILNCFYKNYSLSANSFHKNSLGIIQFKQQKIKNKRLKSKKPGTFFRYDFVICKKSRWVYSSKNFRNILSLRNRIYQYFDGVFSNRFFKKQFKNRFDALDFIRYSFLKPEFRLDIILWRLNFFNSPYSARIAILKKDVLVNGSTVRFSYFLKKGDIVCLNNLVNLNSAMNLKINLSLFQPFLEIDYYTNSFIVLHDYQDLSVDSFCCLIRQPFKAASLLNYLKKI